MYYKGVNKNVTDAKTLVFRQVASVDLDSWLESIAKENKDALQKSGADIVVQDLSELL